MKKNLFRLICALLVLCLLFSGCAVGSGEETRKPRETAEATQPDYSPMQGAAIQYLTAREFSSNRTAGEVSEEFRKSAADFAFKLFNESRADFEGNGLLVSPLSVMLALAMTANGAEGETLAQMEQVLGGGMYIEDLNEQLYNYTASLVSTPNAKFNLANAVWVTSDPSFSINRNFVKQIENTFDADIVAADLPASIDTINSWVKEETYDMIDSILSKDDVSEATVMILLNALAFDALWSEQPSDSSCFEDTFKGVDENIQKATFMWAECNGYIEGKNEIGIVKNYKGGNYAFVALLPNEDISIYDYISSLDGEAFLKLYDKREKSAYNVDISAKMPHFSFDCNVNLNNVLERMGMPRAFVASDAEFNGMGHSAIGNIFVDKVLHKTHIDLDNSGTRAAAVTAVIMVPESAPPGNIKYYRVELDRPFVYAIVDTHTGLPIFLGICENIN